MALSPVPGALTSPRFETPTELVLRLIAASRATPMPPPAGLSETLGRTIVGTVRLPFPGLGLPLVRLDSGEPPLAGGAVRSIRLPADFSSALRRSPSSPSPGERWGIVRPGCRAWVSIRGASASHRGEPVEVQLLVRSSDLVELPSEPRPARPN